MANETSIDAMRQILEEAPVKPSVVQSGYDIVLGLYDLIEEKRAQEYTMRQIWELLCRSGLDIKLGTFRGYFYQICRQRNRETVLGSLDVAQIATRRRRVQPLQSRRKRKST